MTGAPDPNASGPGEPGAANNGGVCFGRSAVGPAPERISRRVTAEGARGRRVRQGRARSLRRATRQIVPVAMPASRTSNCRRSAVHARGNSSCGRVPRQRRVRFRRPGDSGCGLRTHADSRIGASDGGTGSALSRMRLSRRTSIPGIGGPQMVWLFAVQRSANTSFAASATNVPAKVRRIHTSTRGREITCWRTAAASNP
jgi:hypothetical protein